MRARRATLTYASTLAFTLATTATGLLVTPAILRALGDERYGAARVLVEYAGYLALLELGLGGAIAPPLTRALALDDRDALRRVLAAGVRLYGAITLAILAAGLALAPWVAGFARVGPGLAGDVTRAWVVVVLGFLALALAPFRAIFDAEQRAYLVNGFLAVQAVASAALSLGLARVGMGVTGQALATASTTWLVAVATMAAAARRRPGLVASALAARPDPATLAEVRRLGGPSLAVNVAGRVGLLSDSIIVAAILGPAPVAILSVTQRLATMAQGQLVGVGSSAWAALAEIHARGEHALFRRRLVELTRLVSLMGAAALAPIVAYNGRFLALWLGPGKDGGAAVALVAALNALLVAIAGLWIWAFTATGRIGLVARPIVASAAVNLAASVAATRAFGLVGPLLGTTAGYLAVHSWLLPSLLRRHFGVNPAALLRAALAPVAAGAVYGAVLQELARACPPQGWAALAAEMGLAALAFLAFGYATLLAPEDRAAWRLRLDAMRPRRRAGAVHDPVA